MSIFLYTYIDINIYSKNGHDPLSPLNKILSDVISRLLWPWIFPECKVSVGDFDPQTLIRNSLHVLRHAVLDGNHKHTKSL